MIDTVLELQLLNSDSMNLDHYLGKVHGKFGCSCAWREPAEDNRARITSEVGSNKVTDVAKKAGGTLQKVLGFL